MAHENLRFKIDPKNKDWQPIFGNQELDTFFMIYIKINDIYPEEPDNPNTLYIYEYNYRIQNFRGAISFGFEEFPTMTFEDNPNMPTDCDIRIKLTPFSNKYTFGDKCNPFIKEALLRPLKKGDIIDSLGLIQQIPEHVTGNKKLEKLKYIDPRDFSRNGDTLDAIIKIDDGKRKKILEQIDTYDKKTLRNLFKSYFKTKGAAGSTGICCPRISIVI